MDSAYFNVDDILAEEERLACQTNETGFLLGYLDDRGEKHVGSSSLLSLLKTQQSSIFFSWDQAIRLNCPFGWLSPWPLVSLYRS